MKITLGTDVTQRAEFAEFLIANGINTVLGNNEDDVINGVVIGAVDEAGSPQNDVFQSRWKDFLARKINSLPDGIGYINHTYRTHPTPLTRMFTKPCVRISFDTTGAAVILGRAESMPHANAPRDKSFSNALIAAVEKAHPAIEVYVDYRSRAPLVTMSRAAQRACGLSTADMTDFVEQTIGNLA